MVVEDSTYVGVQCRLSLSDLWQAAQSGRVTSCCNQSSQECVAAQYQSVTADHHHGQHLTQS